MELISVQDVITMTTGMLPQGQESIQWALAVGSGLYEIDDVRHFFEICFYFFLRQISFSGLDHVELGLRQRNIHCTNS